MKKTMRVLFMALCLFAAPMGISAQSLVFHLAGGAKSTVSLPATFTVTPTGDKLVIDGGGSVVELAKDDVMCVTYRGKKGDVNNDETVDVADTSTIISIMAGKGGDDPDPNPDPNPDDLDMGKAPEGTEAVDLGLPSGTKWANMNVGAASPTDYGLFFAWGETTGYTSDTSDGRKFNWANYKWMTQGKSSWEWVNKYQVADSHATGCWYKYNSSTQEYDFVGDGLSTLLPEDDAAHANWEGNWYMPTKEDFQELLANTTGEWMTFAGVSGYKFSSKKDSSKFIFLPAAGIREGSSFYFQSSVCNYWSASVYSLGSDYAGTLYSNSGSTFTDFSNRYCGESVRPVLRK